MLLPDLFRDPPMAYRIAPFWFWNGEMDPQTIIDQIQQMALKGVGGFFICARQGLELSYLSEQWFQRVAIAIEAAQQHGLHVWLYDEYPYPSGMSGGEVTLQHPDARHCQLLHHTLTSDGPQALSYTLPWARVLFAQAIPLEEAIGTPRLSHALDLTPYIGSVPAESVFQSTGLTKYTNKRFFTADLQKCLVWDVPPGRWMITVFLEKEIDEFKYFGTYVDPCHKEAIQTFLATTYEPYARHFQAHFGETVKGFFTDEVGLLGRIPWTPRLPAFFRQRYGYELVDTLPALLDPLDERSVQVKYQFFQSLHQLLREVYHRQVSDWCEQHHLQYMAEVPSMRMTTQLYSHVPGGDSAHEKVGRTLEWILDCNAYSLRADPKIVSSLANQLGVERAMIECFHSVGWSMTLQDAKWMLDRLAALGTNFFVFHAFFYSISGLRKHDAPPSQFLQNPYWPYFRHLGDYAGRLSYVMCQGKADVTIAMLHPATSFWTHMGNPFHNFNYCGNDEDEEHALKRLKQDWAYLCKQLLLHQIDYDHLDPELLVTATIEDGQIVLGQARYTVLILPPMTNLEAAAWSQVKAFLRAGGSVISVGLLPYERIEHGRDIKAEALEYFGMTVSPRQSYWQGFAHEDTPLEEVQWTKGPHSAYFIPTPVGSPHSRISESLLALLQQCAPPVVTLEPVVGDRNSFLMRQRNLPDGSKFIFITQQEGTEKTLRLHLPQHLAGQIVERMDLTSGQITTLSTEPTADGCSVLLSFAPYESYLLHCVPGGQKMREDRSVEEDIPAVIALDMEEAWKLTAQQDNILRFGAFHLNLGRDAIGSGMNWQHESDGQGRPVVEAKPLINQCADIAATHPLPMQFRQSFGSPMQGSLAYPLHCWYEASFSVAQLPSTCQLVMDKDAIGGEFIVHLNGHKITRNVFHPTWQHGYEQLACDVQNNLIKGTNHLVVYVEALRDEDGLRDPLYLSGPFAISFDSVGMPTLDKPLEIGKLQGGVQEGYPYFAGTLSFTREIVIETLPNEKRFTLALQGWDRYIHDCVEILLNGNSLGVCCWSPYHWGGESALLHTGMNTVEIRVTNTLSGMLEGSHFDENEHKIIKNIQN